MSKAKLLYHDLDDRSLVVLTKIDQARKNFDDQLSAQRATQPLEAADDDSWLKVRALGVSIRLP